MAVLLLLLTLLATAHITMASSACLGQFAPCSSTGACTMSASTCGGCKSGQYLCPSDQQTCVDGADSYHLCPNLKGTHLDAILTVEERVDYVIAHTSLDEQVAQLSNNAPAIPHLGIPMYQWLNDDVHGVGRAGPNATILPDGCGMGATWSKVRCAPRIGVEFIKCDVILLLHERDPLFLI